MDKKDEMQIKSKEKYKYFKYVEKYLDKSLKGLFRVK